MRRRLLVVLLALAALAVTAFEFPLCASISTSRTQELWVDRYVYASWFADLAEESMAIGDRQPLLDEMRRYRGLYAESILIVDASGVEFVNTGVDTDAAGLAEIVVEVRSNRHPTRPPHRLRPWDPDTLLVATPIGSGLQIDGAVIIEASTVRAKQEILDRWALVLLGGSTALALFAGVAILLSRWVLQPLSRMSHSVSRLTASLPKTSDIDKAGPPARTLRVYQGPPEIRALIQSFDAMAMAVSDSVRAQRQLVADTAHAIRNPLAALAIRLQAMEKAIPQQAHTSFRRASAQVDRLTAILDGLLKLAAAETPAGFDSAQSDAQWPNRCHVVPVVADRVEEWRIAFDEARMTLTIDAMMDMVEAAIPADTLAQILDIALSNSCRYAGAGAQTQVRVHGGKHWVTVSVIDNGTGVSVDEIDNLTTRFFRGSAAIPGGTGLGLPIAAALVQRHHGELTITREVPHGLRVTVFCHVI